MLLLVVIEVRVTISIYSPEKQEPSSSSEHFVRVIESRKRSLWPQGSVVLPSNRHETLGLT